MRLNEVVAKYKVPTKLAGLAKEHLYSEYEVRYFGKLIETIRDGDAENIHRVFNLNSNVKDIMEGPVYKSIFELAESHDGISRGMSWLNNKEREILHSYDFSRLSLYVSRVDSRFGEKLKSIRKELEDAERGKGESNVKLRNVEDALFEGKIRPGSFMWRHLAREIYSAGEDYRQVQAKYESELPGIMQGLESAKKNVYERLFLEVLAAAQNGLLPPINESLWAVKMHEGADRTNFLKSRYAKLFQRRTEILDRLKSTDVDREKMEKEVLGIDSNLQSFLDA